MTTSFRTDDHPVIRIASREDLPALTALLKALLSIEEDESFDGEKQRRGLSMLLDGCGKHRRTLVAELGGQLVGMCSAQILIATGQGRESAMVEAVVVREGYRGRGIGQALMKSLETWARGRGISRFQLLTGCSNTVAIDFYRKQGWGEPRLVCMRKVL